MRKKLGGEKHIGIHIDLLCKRKYYDQNNFHDDESAHCFTYTTHNQYLCAFFWQAQRKIFKNHWHRLRF